MRPCVPLASESKPFSATPFRSRIGGRPAFAFAGIAIAACFVPLDASGQHFYAGLGYGLERPSKAEPADGDCSAVRPAPRDGCGTGASRTPFRMFEDLAGAPAVEPVAEPPPLRTARIEWMTGQGAAIAFEEPSDSSEPEKRRSLSRFIAPSFDIPAIGAPGQGSLSPFLGGGMGAVRTGSGEAPISSWDIGPFVPGASKVGTAWMVTAGVAATLSARATVELSWRYNHSGEAKTGRGSGRVEWRERGRPIPTNLAPTGVEAKSHGVRLSLHYGF